MNERIDLTWTELQTKRLILRPFKLDDLNDFYEYAKVDGVGQMAGWLPHKSIEETKMILNRFIQSNKTFAIVYNNKVIGSVGIEEYPEYNYPELEQYNGRMLGFVLSKNYWGKGLMPEAVKEVMRYLFEEIGLDFIMCGYFAYNMQSARVQEKLGFKFYRNGEYITPYKTVEKTIDNIIWAKDYFAR